MKIGDFNELTLARFSDYGAFLTDGISEVLMPKKYVRSDLSVGDKIVVFVYRDSEDRPVATTEMPFAKVDQFALLRVVEVNRYGAFMDWGLGKELLVPFNEQKVRMEKGRSYIVYLYIDHVTGRIVASAKLEKFLGNVFPDFRQGEEVDVLIVKRLPIGYSCVVNNAHQGMIYASEVYKPLSVGDRIKAYVVKVRRDGKIDLTMKGKAADRTEDLSKRIVAYVTECGGEADIDDSSSPELIAELFQCSKKDFKKALGLLLKKGIISKQLSKTSLLKD